MNRIREYLLLGLLTLTPVSVTVWILVKLVSFFDDALYNVIPIDSPELLGWRLPGLGLLAAFLLILGFGIAAKTFWGQLFGKGSDWILGRVPGIRGIYQVLKQMSQMFFSESGTKESFQRVVRCPFPSPPASSLGFVTGAHSPTESIVFIPTAPNPTSGYVVIFSNEEIQSTSYTVEEALRLILSCGALTPGKKDTARG